MAPCRDTGLVQSYHNITYHKTKCQFTSSLLLGWIVRHIALIGAEYNAAMRKGKKQRGDSMVWALQSEYMDQACA